MAAATKSTRSAAAKAVEAEAVEGGAVSFEYDGETYTVDADIMDDVAVVRAYENETVVTLVEKMLGPVQYARFMSKPRKVSKDLIPFSEAMFAALGASLGE